MDTTEDALETRRVLDAVLPEAPPGEDGDDGEAGPAKGDRPKAGQPAASAAASPSTDVKAVRPAAPPADPPAPKPRKPRASSTARAAGSAAPRAARRVPVEPAPPPLVIAPPLAPRSPREALMVAGRLALTAAFRAAVAASRARPARQAASIAVFFALFGWASVHVRDRVRADLQYRVSKGSLAATVPPRGLAHEAIDDLAAIPLPGRSFSVYDPAAVPTIAAAYRRLPWVRDVRSVQAFYPAVVRFDVLVRRPVCGLAHGGQVLLLDDEGVVLPRRCYAPSDPDALKLPTIVNAPLGRRAIREGQRLEDVPVKHGIAVALSLQAEAFDQLRLVAPISIDVSNVDGAIDPRRSEIVVTAGRTVIEWGRSSATSKLDIPVEEKIAKLRTLLDRDPALASLAHIRLQFDDLEFQERRAAATQ